MKNLEVHKDFRKFSVSGAIITLGIVFGDLGTSPLYTMRAIIAGSHGTAGSMLVYGGLSCVFWTLTLTTTIKYVLIALRADNNGEGGIFALAALIKKHKATWISIMTMIGGAALMADGVITPAITVTSSIEGLHLINSKIPVVPIVLIILAILFFIQQFGTKLIGSSFGPVMSVWFTTLAVLGVFQLVKYPAILQALNPVFAYQFLTEYPGGFVLLGAVFLCTTGAEALYADLGHCGRNNIQVSWGFAKLSLLLNYFGQGAWLMMNPGQTGNVNPFFQIMPDWFLIPGVILATAAAIIASQAIISGSFTIMSEAISLNYWPKIKILYPTYIRGQVYLPQLSWFLWVACSLTVILFRESENMNAAYGLAINITEIMTTILLSYYLYIRGFNHRLVLIFLMTYITIEGSFLVANLHKFNSGGWFTLLLASAYFLIMYGWYFGRKIKNRFITYTGLDRHLEMFRDLSKDITIPKTATNLVYIVAAKRIDQVESKVIYSIFQKQPKRADTYWFIHINREIDPNMFRYHVTHIIPGILIRIDFHTGFKVEAKINLYFREVVEELERSGEIRVQSGFDSVRKRGLEGDFKFVLLDRIMTRDYHLSKWENFVLSLHSLVRKLNVSDIIALNLDSTSTIIEQIPITFDQPLTARISRAQ